MAISQLVAKTLNYRAIVSRAFSTGAIVDFHHYNAMAKELKLPLAPNVDWTLDHHAKELNDMLHYRQTRFKKSEKPGVRHLKGGRLRCKFMHHLGKITDQQTRSQLSKGWKYFDESPFSANN